MGQPREAVTWKRHFRILQPATFPGHPQELVMCSHVFPFPGPLSTLRPIIPLPFYFLVLGPGQDSWLLGALVFLFCK